MQDKSFLVIFGCIFNNQDLAARITGSRDAVKLIGMVVSGAFCDLRKTPDGRGTGRS